MNMFEGRKLSEKQEKLLEANIFLGKMLAVGAVFHMVLWLYPDTSGIQAYYAEIIASIMNFFGYSFRAESVFILPGYEITQDCLGWKSMMAFTALVFSSTKRYRKNLKYVLAGTAVILVANTVRIITTIHLSEIGLISFEIIHGFLWKWSLTALVLIAWIYWFHRYRSVKTIENPET